MLRLHDHPGFISLAPPIVVGKIGAASELARHGGPWFLGSVDSAIDAHLLTLARWSRTMTRPAAGRTHPGPYLRRRIGRPAVRRVHVRERLPQPWF